MQCGWLLGPIHLNFLAESWWFRSLQSLATPSGTLPWSLMNQSLQVVTRCGLSGLKLFRDERTVMLNLGTGKKCLLIMPMGRYHLTGNLLVPDLELSLLWSDFSKEWWCSFVNRFCWNAKRGKSLMWVGSPVGVFCLDRIIESLRLGKISKTIRSNC